MFNGRIKSRLDDVELDIYLLKNPPKFKIGDRVTTRYFPPSGGNPHVSNTTGTVIKIIPPTKKGYSYNYEIYDEINKCVYYWSAYYLKLIN